MRQKITKPATSRCKFLIHLTYVIEFERTKISSSFLWSRGCVCDTATFLNYIKKYYIFELCTSIFKCHRVSANNHNKCFSDSWKKVPFKQLYPLFQIFSHCQWMSIFNMLTRRISSWSKKKKHLLCIFKPKFHLSSKYNTIYFLTIFFIPKKLQFPEVLRQQIISTLSITSSTIYLNVDKKTHFSINIIVNSYLSSLYSHLINFYIFWHE